MIRNLKVLGLAVVALLAMSAMTASAASAASFTSSANTTNVSGSGANLVFEVTGLAVNCTTANLEGEGTGTSGSSTTVTVIILTGCTAKLGVFNVNATVTGFSHNGGTCHVVINASGTADLKCSSGEVTADAGTCTVHIPAQTGLGTISFTNGTSGGKGDITGTVNVSGIQVSHTDGFGCPFAGSGSGKIGTVQGSVTATGTDTLGNPVSISHDA